MLRFLSVTLSGAVLAACAGTPQMEVCQQQIVADVASRFQQNVTHIDFQFAERRPAAPTIPPLTGRAVVRVAECPGYHVYEVFGTDYDCLYRPHYGHSQRYVWYRTSAEGCEG